MLNFFTDLTSYTFLQYAVITAVLTSISCGIVGSLVTVRRLTYIAGAIAHCTLGGMGLFLYMKSVHGWWWATPMLGATTAALIAAFIIGTVTYKSKQRQDTILSAVWSIGMAIGIFFISKTPGYNTDLMSYLFGNILMVSKTDMIMIMVLDIVLILSVFFLYNKMLAISFDEEFVKLRGVRVRLHYQVLLILIALTVVLLTQVVGLVMVIALLTLPAATASNFIKQLWQMMVVSCVLSLFLIVGGLAISYGPDLPAGATIILLAGSVYLLVLAFLKLRFFVYKKNNH